MTFGFENNATDTDGLGVETKETSDERAHDTKRFDVLLGGGERPRIYMTRSYDAGDANFENNRRVVD